jgi:chorismate dehydratase
MRIGVVGFANTLPLAQGLEALLPGASLLRATPAAIADGLHAGSLDVGLAPVAALTAHPEWTVIPGLGIASEGPVRSVLLLSRVAPDRITRLVLDPASRTSNFLARLWLKHRVGVEPEVLAGPSGAAQRLLRGDATVAIGDDALFFAGSTAQSIDLGGAWAEWTGLPFVFAVWAGPRADAPELAPALHTCYRENAKRIEVLAEGAAGGDPVRKGILVPYLRDSIRYGWAAREPGPRPVSRPGFGRRVLSPPGGRSASCPRRLIRAGAGATSPWKPASWGENASPSRTGSGSTSMPSSPGSVPSPMPCGSARTRIPGSPTTSTATSTIPTSAPRAAASARSTFPRLAPDMYSPGRDPEDPGAPPSVVRSFSGAPPDFRTEWYEALPSDHGIPGLWIHAGSGNRRWPVSGYHPQTLAAPGRGMDSLPEGESWSPHPREIAVKCDKWNGSKPPPGHRLGMRTTATMMFGSSGAGTPGCTSSGSGPQDETRLHRVHRPALPARSPRSGSG